MKETMFFHTHIKSRLFLDGRPHPSAGYDSDTPFLVVHAIYLLSSERHPNRQIHTHQTLDPIASYYSTTLYRSYTRICPLIVFGLTRDESR